MEPTKVLLVDDHILFRKGLISLLSGQDDMEIVGECSDGAEALDRARELMPDVVLMDIRMPGVDGLEATRRMTAEMPHVKVVMLTVSEDDKDLFEAIKSGARGYLLKDLEPEDLYHLVRAVAAGEAALSPSMAAKILDEFGPARAREQEEAAQERVITEREKEILGLLMEGLGNKQIAHRLYISESTVRNHIHNILYKLHLENRVQLAIYAYQRSLKR
ncbi:MAG: response regulator transcription factor [Dehalococcoidia bacterium]